MDIDAAFKVSIPFSSGKSFRRGERQGHPDRGNQFQSPSHRGSLSDAKEMLRIEQIGEGEFQSPSHRGSLSDPYQNRAFGINALYIGFSRPIKIFAFTMSSKIGIHDPNLCKALETKGNIVLPRPLPTFGATCKSHQMNKGLRTHP
jgi:hypothetical protein